MPEITAAQIKELREKTGCGMMDAKRALNETKGDEAAAIELLRKQGVLKSGKVAGRVTGEGRVSIATSADKLAAALVAVQCETDFTARNEAFTALAEGVAKSLASAPTADLAVAAFPAGGTVGEAMQALTAKTGENVKLGRSARLAVSAPGFFGSYIHSDGKLGVLVALEGGDGASDAEKALAKDLAMHAAAAVEMPILAVDRTGISPEVIAREKATLVEIARNDPKNAGKPDNILQKIVDGQVNAYIKDRCFVDQPFVKDPKITCQQQIEAVGKQVGKKLALKAFARIKVGETA